MRSLWFVAALLISMGAFADSNEAARSCVRWSESDWSKLSQLLAEDNPHARAWGRLYKKVQESQTSCAERLSQPRYKGCLDNLSMFVENQWRTRQAGHSMQFLPRDAEYLATQPREMLSFPEPLKDGLPKNWREVCEQEGYECLPFVSASLPNPPDLSFGRLLIVETGALFDRWMLYTTPREGDETKERLIDFLGVEKASIDPATGELIPLQKTRLHFAEYWRDRDGKSPVYRKNIAACYKCHPSGMRDIIPAYGSVDEEGEALADSLNQKMAEYGDFDWGAGTINVAAYGPPMGEKQGCTDCHDGVLRGSLNAAHLGERSRHQIYFKMVQSLVMPPDVTSPPIAVAKAKLLAAQDKGELYQTNPLKTLTTMLRVDLGSDRGPMAASNEEILYLLSRRELITQEEYDAAMLEQKEREQNASDLYEEMTREYRTTLEEWLRGERDACAGLFSVD